MYSVAYSLDGAKIISCSEDIRNWNAQSATMHRNMKQVCIQTWKGSQFSWLIIERSQFMEELTVRGCHKKKSIVIGSCVL